MVNETTKKMEHRLAESTDDLRIRHLLKSSPMEGKISISMETEPSYFDALQVQGKESQVMILTRGDEVINLGARSIKPAYVNGQLTDIGYLGGLRTNPSFKRSGVHLARGYEFLRELDKDGRVPFYVSTIIEDNHVAREILESGRTSVPNYYPLERLLTFMIKPHTKKPEGLVEVVAGDSCELEEIFDFINKGGSKKQFSPHYEPSDFKTGRFRGLSLNDFHIALDKGNIVGLIAKWDQEQFKQTRVVKYDKKMKLFKPLVNFASQFSNISSLPTEGNLLHYAYLSFPTALNNDPLILRELLFSVISDPRNSHYDYFNIGLSESDKLTEAVKPFSPREYPAIIYAVSFDKTLEELNLDRKMPSYLEIATL